MKTPGKLSITRGLPASGKTTWAREQINDAPVGAVVRLNRDDLRAMLYGADYRVPIFTCEERVTAVQQGAIVDLLKAGVDVIVDDTNLRARNVRDLAQFAVQAGAEWECVDQFLAVPVETCIERDALRDRPVGEDVITGFYRKYLSGGRTLPVPDLGETVAGKPYVPVPGTPSAVIVDVDGTVALHGSRNPYDTSRYHEDTPNAGVVEAIRNEDSAVCNILFCSGRSEEFRAVTETWLAEHVGEGEADLFDCPEIGGWQLFMRPAGDTRNDAIIKSELFDQHIRDHYDVRRVYDDRDRVIKMWRSLGLTVLQCAEGNF